MLVGESISTQPKILRCIILLLGRSSITAPISVNGHPFDITVNLEAALRQLRAKGINRVWVDALCINQADRQEHSLQVRNMKLIYSKAEEVIAWIGKGSKNSAFVIESMRGFRRDDASVLPKELPPLRHFQDLCRRPYWERIWIVQEIAVASRVRILCGPAEIEWEDFIIGCRGYWNLEYAYDTAIEKITDMRDRYRKSHLALLKCIDDTHSAESSDPRDKIFVLLGLCEDGPLLVPYPNYVQQFDEIVYDLTKAIIRKVRSLDLLHLMHSGDQTQDNSSSWAPDWVHMGTTERKFIIKGLNDSKSCDSFRWHEFTSSKVLRVEGLRISTIAHIQDSTTLSGKEVPQAYYPDIHGPSSLRNAFMACFGGPQHTVYNGNHKMREMIQWELLSNLWTETGHVNSRKRNKIKLIIENGLFFRGSLPLPWGSILDGSHYPFIWPGDPNRFRIRNLLIAWLDSLSSFPIATQSFRQWTSQFRNKSLRLELLVQR
jgi:hypothetical protein